MRAVLRPSISIWAMEMEVEVEMGVEMEVSVSCFRESHFDWPLLPEDCVVPVQV